MASLSNSSCEAQLAQLDRIANRTTISLTLTGMTIGSAIALRTALSRERDRFGSVVGYAGAASFALSMLSSSAVLGQALWDSWRRWRGASGAAAGRAAQPVEQAGLAAGAAALRAARGRGDQQHTALGQGGAAGALGT